ncbi:MAG: hypothetical protein ACM3SM_02545 [Bacteroidota bacterium]
MMRITDRTVSREYLISMNKSKNEVQKLQMQLTTGSKISNPSDSPSGTGKILRIENQLGNNQVYKKNLDEGLSFVNTSVSVMESIYNRVQEANQVLSEINNAANLGNTELYSKKIDDILNSMLELANTEYDGKYIFGGTDFAEAPYGFEDAPAPGTSAAVEVKVSSVAGEQKIKTGKDSYQKINTTGDELFGTVGTGDIFNTLISIRDELKDGTRPSIDQANIVQDFGQHVLNKISASGDTINRLDNTNELVDNQILELKTLLSDEQDVDDAEAIMDLQNQQYYLDLSYKMSSMIMTKSLLDYL